MVFLKIKKHFIINKVLNLIHAPWAPRRNSAGPSANCDAAVNEHHANGRHARRECPLRKAVDYVPVQKLYARLGLQLPRHTFGHMQSFERAHDAFGCERANLQTACSSECDQPGTPLASDK